MSQLLLQAPSFQLSSYISNLQKQQTTAGDADLARDLHEAHAALRSAVTSAKQQLQQLQELAEQYTDAALSKQLANGKGLLLELVCVKHVQHCGLLQQLPSNNFTSCRV